MNKAIRVSREYNVIKEWFTKFDYDKIVVFEHPMDEKVSRTHVHIMVIGLKVKTDNLKYHLKKIDSTLNGRTDWSFSEKEVNDEFITYMSKGKYIPKLVKGYTEEEIHNYTKMWKEPVSLKTEGGKLILDKPVKETKKKTKRELIELMKARYTEDLDVADTIKIIRKILIDNNEVIGMYKVMDYYDSLIMYSDKHKFIDMVVAKINSRTRI